MKAAAAPPVPAVLENDTNVRSIPPFGANPPRGPVAEAPSDPTTRLIRSDPRELWYLALPSKLAPRQVLQILRSALAGDIWQQWQLCSLMLDSWPMLRKCSREVRDAVAGANYIVKPYVARRGQDPTPSAVERAELVERAMASFRPEVGTDEKGFNGMVYDLSDAMLNGLAAVELLWHDVGGELLPRASCWVHPRHYTFTDDGKVTMFDAVYNRLTWTLTAPGRPVDPRRFMIGQFVSRSGSSLGNGLMRPLAWYWSAMVFNREWMLKFAQRYGSGFLEVAYKVGTPAGELDKLKEFAEEAGSQGWVMYVEGTTVKFNPPQSLGTDNPHMNIRREADEQCQFLLLGQTGTTQGTAGKLGEDTSRKDVKRESVQAVADWSARVLTEQFAPAVLRANYGDDTSECPTVAADFTEETDPVEEAQRDAVMLSAKVPMVADEFYARHNMKKPQSGDEVIVGGRLGKLGATDEEISQEPEPAAPPFGADPGAGQGDSRFGKGRPAPGEAGENGEDESGVEALRATLAKATPEELAEIKATLDGARGRSNGEWRAAQVKIKQIGRRRAT